MLLCSSRWEFNGRALAPKNPKSLNENREETFYRWFFLYFIFISSSSLIFFLFFEIPFFQDICVVFSRLTVSSCTSKAKNSKNTHRRASESLKVRVFWYFSEDFKLSCPICLRWPIHILREPFRACSRCSLTRERKISIRSTPQRDLMLDLGDEIAYIDQILMNYFAHWLAKLLSHSAWLEVSCELSLGHFFYLIFLVIITTLRLRDEFSIWISFFHTQKFFFFHSKNFTLLSFLH